MPAQFHLHIVDHTSCTGASTPHPLIYRWLLFIGRDLCGGSASGMKIKIGVHVVFVALCSVVSMVGYCFNGSVPALELMLALSRYHRPTPAGPPTTNEQLTTLSRTLPCSCPVNQLRNINNVNNGTLVADEPRSHFISSHVVEVLPLKKLQQSVPFSRHRGLSHLDHTALNRFYLCRNGGGGDMNLY